MKIFHFLALLAISVAFLSCTFEERKHSCAMKVLAKTCNDERCWYDESDSFFFGPYDHNWVSIEEAVKEWMEEQFATGKNDTMLFSIVDLFIHENYFSTLDIDGPTGREYYVDGRRVSIEEYNDSIAKREGYEQERVARGKRNLPIPAPILNENEYPTSVFYWGVPMTAKEIAELTENYKILSIEFLKEGTNANDEITLPPAGGSSPPSSVEDNRPDC